MSLGASSEHRHPEEERLPRPANHFVPVDDEDREIKHPESVKTV
jgi:hypothetical protein